MIERQLWHPVSAVADIPPLRPMATRLLEVDLALWRDTDGVLHAWSDRCPHRGTRLSLGRIDANRLECPYHGWQFDHDGRCVAIPADPGFSPPSTHNVTAFDLQLAHGLVWVRLERATSDLPAFPAASDPNLRQVLCGPYDVASSAPRIVENFLDLAHFGLVHPGLLGDRDHLALDAYEVAIDAGGVHATRCRVWQPQSNRLATAGSMVEYEYHVPAPYTAVLSKVPQAQAGFRESIALFTQPIDHETSRVWFVLAMSERESTDADLRAFQDTIFRQDQPIVESQRPKRLPLEHGELHSSADRLSAAYRRYLRQCGVTCGVCREPRPIDPRA